MMSLPANLNSIAALALDRMLYGLAEGIALAGLLSLAMRLFPPKNSRTRFAVWFAALMVMAMLPLLGAAGMPAGHARAIASSAHSGGPSGPDAALFTIPAFWAESILVVWVALGMLGLLRVGAGLWHVHRLRRSCIAINPELLGPELQSAIAELKLSRRASILVSPGASVPAAVGFFRPVVIVPEWLAEESAAGELYYVLLHELAHLRRWDDWTNLAQKVVKAALFFHPGIWWIEGKLSLDREMACDEAVLSEAAEPRLYAQCLARVAEKSFLRRQMAMAQAAVDRMKHLSQRITRILSVNLSEDERRARSAPLWKPAVAMVVGAGVVSAAWTSQAPRLVGLADPAPSRTRAAAGSSSAGVVTEAAAREARRRTERQTGGGPVLTAAAGAKAHPAVMVPALYRSMRSDQQSRAAFSQKQKRSVRQNPRPIQAQYTPSESAPSERGEVLVTVVETQFVTSGQTAGAALWQISVVEVRWIVPEHHAKKEIPRKT
jgi:beta-lactamase regulating signal transducer with metallopeptidase domain